MKSIFYRMVQIDEKGPGLSSILFKKPYVENNKVWRLGGSSLHLIEEKDHIYSLLPTRLTQSAVKINPLRLSVDEHKKLVSYLYEKGWVTRYNLGGFMDDEDQLDFFESEIYELEKLMKHPERYSPESVERIRVLIEEISEGGVPLNSIQVTVKKDGGYAYFDFSSHWFIILDHSFLRNMEESEKFVREFMCEVATALEMVSPTDAPKPVPLSLQKYVPHPLTDMDKVLDTLYSSVTSEQLSQLGLSSEELELIRLSLYASASRAKGKEIPVSEFERMKQDLRKNDKVKEG